MFNCIIYADEMIFRNTVDQTTSDVLTKEISTVNDWLKVNKLSLNVQKSKYMIFIHRRNMFQFELSKLIMWLLKELLDLIFVTNSR